MDGMTESDTPPPSKLEKWIADLTARYADERRRPYPTAAAVTAAARDIERSFIPGAFSLEEWDESRRRTAARLQAQSEAQHFRRPWLDKDLVKI